MFNCKFISIFCLLLASVARSMALSTDSLRRTVAAGIPVEVISVNLADPRVHVCVQVARGAESMSALLSRSRPTIAINGAYFSVNSSTPIGDIVIGGKYVCFGGIHTALSISQDNDAVIRRNDRPDYSKPPEYETVLGCGPALVLNGRVDVKPAEEGFHDPHIMGSTRRMGVGIKPSRQLLLVHTLASVTFQKWGEVMLALGCDQAMNLDAGASLGMYYRGRTLLNPGRNLTNMLLVYVDRPLPDRSILSPPPLTYRRSTSMRTTNIGESRITYSNPAPLPPTDSTAPDAILVHLCADSMHIAKESCPVVLNRHIPKNKIPTVCSLRHGR